MLILIPLISFSQDLTLRDSGDIAYGLPYTAESILKEEARIYNSHIFSDERPMRPPHIDYVDSITVTGKIRFITHQTFNRTRWEATATFYRQGDRYVCEVSEISKISSTLDEALFTAISGDDDTEPFETPGPTPLQEHDGTISSKLLKKVEEKINEFFDITP